MDKTQLALIITLAVMTAFCVPTARASLRRQKIYGGAAAQVFHFIGVMAYLGVPPALLSGTLLVGFLALGLPLALTLMGLALVALLGYASIERTARVQQATPAWTEADARSSGL